MVVTTTIDVSWVAIVVGTVGYQLLGALWYGPLFGSRWLAAMGFTGDAHPEDPGPTGYLLTAAGAFVALLGLGILLDWVGAATWLDGLVVGLVAGLGFVATTAVQAVPFEDQPWTVYLLNVSYNVIALAAGGILLVVL